MSFTEKRYPFNNLLEYFSEYFFKIDSLHIFLGYIFIFFILFIVIKSELSNCEKIGTLTIFFWPFNNPAYTYHISISEFFLILNSFFVIFTKKKYKYNKFLVLFLILLFLIFLHFFVVNTYFLFSNNHVIDFKNKLAVLFKILFIPFLFFSFSEVSSLRKLSVISKIGSTVAALISIIYIFQIIIFLSGYIPFGTYVSANEIHFPSFGGVSIERGHLSKFMVPFLPFLLLNVYLNKGYVTIALYFFMMLINFSSSGYTFFLIALLNALFFCRKLFSNKLKVIFFIFVLMYFILFFKEFTAVFEKIYTLVILSNQNVYGGRDWSTALQYFNLYPFGMGYSGSSYRNLQGLPEMNMGIFAMFVQINFISILFYFLMIISSFIMIKRSDNVVEKLLCVGVFLMPIVFSADILWFVPTYWAPLILLSYFQLYKIK